MSWVACEISNAYYYASARLDPARANIRPGDFLVNSPSCSFPSSFPSQLSQSTFPQSLPGTRFRLPEEGSWGNMGNKENRVEAGW